MRAACKQAQRSLTWAYRKSSLWADLDATRDYVCCMWLMLQQQQPADFVIGTGVNTAVKCISLPPRR